MDKEWYTVTGIAPWVSSVADGVTEIEFSEGFKEISENSLRKPKTLQKIIIPASCEKVGKGCFLDCPELTSFEVKAGNKKYKATDGSLISHDGKHWSMFQQVRVVIILYPIMWKRLCHQHFLIAKSCRR